MSAARPITLPPAYEEWVRALCARSGATSSELITVAIEMGPRYAEQVFVPQMAARRAAREAGAARRGRHGQAARAGRRV